MSRFNHKKRVGDNAAIFINKRDVVLPAADTYRKSRIKHGPKINAETIWTSGTAANRKNIQNGLVTKASQRSNIFKISDNRRRIGDRCICNGSTAIHISYSHKISARRQHFRYPRYIYGCAGSILPDVSVCRDASHHLHSGLTIVATKTERICESSAQNNLVRLTNIDGVNRI